MDYVIYSDESDSIGVKFSNFYGGVIVKREYVHVIEHELDDVCKKHNMNLEMKWNTLSSDFLERYILFIDTFFEILENSGDLMRVRIMFTDNRYEARSLTSEQKRNTYYMLYYQFIKHSFGIKHCKRGDAPSKLFFALDHRPTTKKQRDDFVNHLREIFKTNDFRSLGIDVEHEHVSFVDSRHHRILQALDIVLGAMCFRLNDKHLIKPVGAKRRGKKTRVREKLYKHIKDRVWRIKPNFNIGMSTGWINQEDKWSDKYRHWIFIPKEYFKK